MEADIINAVYVDNSILCGCIGIILHCWAAYPFMVNLIYGYDV